MTKTIVPETHRALLFKNEQFHDVLLPGVHKRSRLTTDQYRMQLVDISKPLEHGVADETLGLLKLHGETLSPHLQHWETGEHEVGLLYQDGVLRKILAPAQQGAFWQGFATTEVRKLDISDDFVLDKKLARLVLAAREPMLRDSAVHALTTGTIAEGHKGFLEVEGIQTKTLSPGIHAFWKFNL